MSYRIDYAPVHKPGAQPTVSRSCVPLMTAGFFAIFLLLLSAFWQEGAALLRALFLGDRGESMLACLEQIAASLGDGLSLRDAAVGAFRDVIYGH